LADPPIDYPLLIRRLGELGAHALRQQLHDNVKISLMWGTTIYEVVWAMPSLALADSNVIQMIGTVGRGNPLIDGPELARSLAQKLNASYSYLPAPIIVEDETVARSFLQQPAIAEVLDQVRQVDLALLGIGTSNDYFSYLKATGYVKNLDLLKLQESGAVGSILGLFIDKQGRPLDVSINRRVIGFRDMDTLRTIPTVMACAGGIKKATAILAALQGGYLGILVTDAVTATAVLSLYESHGEAAGNQEKIAIKSEVLING
jgi:DNA-binding transcriptional regulator LsrR (DeoR family)